MSWFFNDSAGMLAAMQEAHKEAIKSVRTSASLESGGLNAPTQAMGSVLAATIRIYAQFIGKRIRELHENHDVRIKIHELRETSFLLNQSALENQIERLEQRVAEVAKATPEARDAALAEQIDLQADTLRGLMLRLDKADRGKLDSDMKTFERRASRHADHLSAIEGRLKILEHKREK